MVLQHRSVGNPYIGIPKQVFSQCRNLPQSYVAILLAIATNNLFHNFLSLKTQLPFSYSSWLYGNCFIRVIDLHGCCINVTVLLEYFMFSTDQGAWFSMSLFSHTTNAKWLRVDFWC